MTDKRYKFGLFVSVFWVLAMIGLLVIKRADIVSMAPNAWGDFFAGSFAPLAFLWLVLGYLQQGEELRLSTQALRLQADELRNSVEQQAALVEVSRLQLEAEREALSQERAIRVEEARPIIQLTSAGGSFRGDGQSRYTIQAVNVGNTATALVADLLHKDGRKERLLARPILDRGGLFDLNIEVASPLAVAGMLLLISFKDKIGHSTTLQYAVSRESADPHSSLVLVQTAKWQVGSDSDTTAAIDPLGRR